MADRPTETPPGDSPEPVERPSAAVVCFPGKPVAKRLAPPAADQLTREDREKVSTVVNSSVEYVQMMSGMIAGFRADHTGDSVVAGWNGTQGEKVEKRAKAAIRRLVRRISTHATRPLEVTEIWSVASVTKFVMRQWRSKDWEIDDNDPEMELLELFPAIIEKLCEGLYRAELKADRQEEQQ